MTFDFHPDALKEYEEAGLWYEEQRYRLGIEFAESIDAAIAVILAEPTRFQPVGDGVRIYQSLRKYRQGGRVCPSAPSLAMAQTARWDRRALPLWVAIVLRKLSQRLIPPQAIPLLPLLPVHTGSAKPIKSCESWS